MQAQRSITTLSLSAVTFVLCLTFADTLMAASVSKPNLCDSGFRYAEKTLTEIRAARLEDPPVYDPQEAVMKLSNVATVQAAFYAEFATYSTHLPPMGYAIAPGEANYSVGFSGPSEIGSMYRTIIQNSYSTFFVGFNQAINDSEIFRQALAANNNSIDFGPLLNPQTGEETGERYKVWMNPARKLERLDFRCEAVKWCGPEGCKANELGFKAAAVGYVPSTGKLDVWTIDHTHTLTHVVNGQ